MTDSLTIIIPAYNDAAGLERIIPEVLEVCTTNDWRLIVVNDCSTDDTATLLDKYSDRLTTLTNKRNMGYGASIKRGIIKAETTWVATMDADGQHRLDDLERMAHRLKSDLDAVVGVRNEHSDAPMVRRPGKWVLHHVANLLTGEPIPDINCGLRILRRATMRCILNLTSDRFSFSTSTLVALNQLGASVDYCPVTLERRIGKSSVRQVRDGLYTILLLTRLIVLFNPMRVMLPIGTGLFGLGVVYQIISAILLGLSINKLTILLCLSGLMIFMLALMTDQISALRRDMILRELSQNDSDE